VHVCVTHEPCHLSKNKFTHKHRPSQKSLLFEPKVSVARRVCETLLQCVRQCLSVSMLVSSLCRCLCLFLCPCLSVSVSASVFVSLLVLVLSVSMSVSVSVCLWLCLHVGMCVCAYCNTTATRLSLHCSHKPKHSL